LQCVAVCCSECVVSKDSCVAVCCSALQCVAVSSVYQKIRVLQTSAENISGNVKKQKKRIRMKSQFRFF